MLPVPSGSRTLKALRITSSGSAPGEDRRKRLVKVLHSCLYSKQLVDQLSANFQDYLDYHNQSFLFVNKINYVFNNVNGLYTVYVS